MTFGLLIKIAVIAAIVGIVIARRRDKKGAVLEGLEQMRTSDWQGWIEIANSDYQPLFQGKIVATAQDYAGALLFGVLLEENAPAALVTAIKDRPFKHLTEGRVLVRGLTAHDKKLITTELNDQDLIRRLCSVMDQEAKPETCLVLNSYDIRHMDSPEGMAQFEKIWETSLSKQEVRDPLPASMLDA
ncbi:MAG: hypothetical protein P8X96_17010, partial [Desulfobacteraceae bacterium]